VREANEAESLSLRLVMECRHVWGNRSAAELWEKRGLPMVPAMDAIFRQGDLFERATLVPQCLLSFSSTWLRRRLGLFLIFARA
jgi:hypothetical protein